mmetsp:Transcript_77090/g.160470  ORF Transcript_77090/g.160470 Transcript_77090/m.160470 type:complete len:213 (+) Transcript_77090:726-1364(+)
MSLTSGTSGRAIVRVQLSLRDEKCMLSPSADDSLEELSARPLSGACCGACLPLAITRTFFKGISSAGSVGRLEARSGPSPQGQSSNVLRRRSMRRRASNSPSSVAHGWWRSCLEWTSNQTPGPTASWAKSLMRPCSLDLALSLSSSLLPMPPAWAGALDLRASTKALEELVDLPKQAARSSLTPLQSSVEQVHETACPSAAVLQQAQKPHMR